MLRIELKQILCDRIKNRYNTTSHVINNISWYNYKVQGYNLQ